MIFHTKCRILLILCTIKYTMKQCVADDTSVTFHNEDTEENAIKEALLLVELLKNAQDKPILRTTETTVEDSTCAATTLETLTATTPDHNATSSSIYLETQTTASVPSLPDEQFPQYRRAFLPNWPRMPSPHSHHDHHYTHDDPHEPLADFYRPRGFFRRQFPNYYYFQNDYDFPRVMKQKPIPGFRRFENDVTQTNSASPVSSTTKTTLGKPNSSTMKTTSGKSNSSTTETKLGKPNSSTLKTTLGTSTKVTTTKLEKPNMTTKGKVTTDHDKAKDSLHHEIATELLKELNGTKIVAKQKQKIMKKITQTTTEKVRTTLRIYLGGSTRYNIPFPENHAFCFTNPESILCRTP